MKHIYGYLGSGPALPYIGVSKYVKRIMSDKRNVISTGGRLALPRGVKLGCPAEMTSGAMTW
jgi:hypothetical protein